MSDSYVIVAPHPIDLDDGRVGTPGDLVELEEDIAGPLRLDGFLVRAQQPAPPPYEPPVIPPITTPDVIEPETETKPDETKPAPRKRTPRRTHHDPAPAEKQEQS